MKKPKGIFIILLVLSLSFSGHGRAQGNDLEAGLFNIGIGMVLGGTGAVINKEPDERFGKVLLKGIAQGALGGYVIFESKRLVREFAESGDFGYVWPSKLVNSAGTSIIENAAANRNFWERWHLNFGFNRFEVNVAEDFRFSYRIMPFALYGTISSFSEGTFLLENSLRMGTFVFETSEIDRDPGIFGQTRISSILILDVFSGRASLPHELLHVYQYERLSGFNAFFDKPMQQLSDDFSWLKTYNKIFYTDFNAVLHSSLYILANPDQELQMQDNLFEREAEFYSNTLPRQRYYHR